MSTPQAQAVRRWILTGAITAITVTGAIYGAGLKSKQEFKQVRRHQRETVQHILPPMDMSCPTFLSSNPTVHRALTWSRNTGTNTTLMFLGIGEETRPRSHSRRHDCSTTSRTFRIGQQEVGAGKEDRQVHRATAGEGTRVGYEMMACDGYDECSRALSTSGRSPEP